MHDDCKSCVHRRNDYSEGQLCWKVDRIITFSSGATMDWPGQSVSDAYEKCGGALREPRTFGRLVYWLGL
jgi:hypothetical protein